MSRVRSERGVVSTELAIIMPVFFAGFLMLVVFAGRIAQAEGDVQSAAQEAARAATLTGDAGTADAVARSVVDSNLQAAGMACANGLNVAVDVTDFNPGGYVTVTVICNADFSDVTSLAVPGSRPFSSQAREIIDVRRSATTP